jgi:hypothetical protein
MVVPLGGGPVPYSLGITRHAALARTARKLPASMVRGHGAASLSVVSGTGAALGSDATHHR